MKAKAKKAVAKKEAKARVRGETWQNMTVIGHAFQAHPDATKPYCAVCGWPQGNHMS